VNAARDEYFNLPLEVDEASGQEAKVFVLVIYDVSDNRRRTRFATLLTSFGHRVQESAFEAVLAKRHLARLLDRIARFAHVEDNIRIYKLRGAGSVTFYGPGQLPVVDDFEFV
jgi:CRISPR-associated endonuclease Cas2